MKKSLLTFLLLSVSWLILKGQNNEAKELMIAVNQEWEHQPDEYTANVNLDNTMSDYLLIQKHLILVEKALRNKSVDHLSADQIANRKKNLDNLRTYWKSGNFPVNTFMSVRNPVFIDEFNNYCAVGYLIKSSGNENLARKIAHETNFAYIREMNDTELGDWAANSGLSKDELAWIQPGYPPTTEFNHMGKGTNGIVYDIVEGKDGNIIVAGEFSEADEQAAKNIAEWMPGFSGYSWLQVGGGIEGTVRALLYHNDILYAAGNITKAGQTNVTNIAKFDGIHWSAVGSLNGTVNDLIVYHDEIYAAGDFTDTGNTFENIAKWNETQWVSIGADAMKIDGVVETMAISSGHLIIGGEFTSAGILNVNNIVEFDGTKFLALGNGLPAKVRTITAYHHNLYAAGDFISGADTFGIARFSGSGWENLMHSFGYLGELDDFYVSSMTVQDDELIVVGKFEYTPMIGTFSRNMVSYSGSWFNGIGNVDSTVNVVHFAKNLVYMGGYFKNSHTGWSGDKVKLNSITNFTLNPGTGINGNNADNNSLEIYPNPFTYKTMVKLNEHSNGQLKELHIYDLSGKLVLPVNNIQGSSVEISADKLSKGIYMINAIGTNGPIGSQKLIVN